MKKNLFDLTIEEFVRVLCGVEKIHTMKVSTTEPSDGFSFKGTYHDIVETLKKFDAQEALDDFKENNFDYDLDLSSLDIYNYLEHKTNGFQKEKCKLLLQDMDVYFHMYIEEDRLDMVNDWIKNGGDPILYDGSESFAHNSKTGETIYHKENSINYKATYKLAFGYTFDNDYAKAIYFLQEKIKSKKPQHNLKSMSEFLNKSKSFKIVKDTEPQPDKTTNDKQELSNRELECFKKAIEAGYMQKTDTGYKWTFGGDNGGKVRLAYFLTKVYGKYEIIPYKRLEGLFGVSRLDSSVSQLANAKKPQKWREGIDNLFQS